MATYKQNTIFIATKEQVKSMQKISVIIPAHNEEKYIGRCLDSIQSAAKKVACEIETVVCLNRCTDKTAAIAANYNCILVEEPQANVALVRNRAIYASTGDIICTLDADSFVSDSFFHSVLSQAQKHQYLGGAVWLLPDKYTFATWLLGILFVIPALVLFKFSGGMFWFHRKALEDVKGFNPAYLTGEDVQFWWALKKAARKRGLKFGLLTSTRVYTSTRKLDELGPWFIFKNPWWIYQAFRGNNQKFADKYLYQTSRTTAKTNQNQ